MQRMRILHLLDHSVPVHSGYAYRTLEILKQQRALGWETVQITSIKHPGAGALVEDAEGVTFHRTLPTGGRLERSALLNPLEVIRGLTRRATAVARAVRPDILHAHSPSLNGVAALAVARRLGLPVVYEVRALWEDGTVDQSRAVEGGWRYRTMRGLETWVLRRADHVTTICDGLRAEIVGRGIGPGRVTVVPNAVDPKRLPASDRHDPDLGRRLGLVGARVVGFIGSFFPYEGLELLLRALPRILARCPDVRVLLVGGGMEDAALRRVVAELGVADRVVFTGWVAHDAVGAYYGLADLLVYPRLSNRVTELVTPLKPLEAMGQGRLVVASDVGGHRELIRPGATGWLFGAGNVDALANTVVAALGDPEGARRIRADARRFVETERTWEASVGRYVEAYRAALDRRGLTAR
jgi:PEP-CTERM/exosortase A-associated glycosyltransferase